MQLHIGFSSGFLLGVIGYIATSWSSCTWNGLRQVVETRSDEILEAKGKKKTVSKYQQTCGQGPKSFTLSLFKMMIFRDSLGFRVCFPTWFELHEEIEHHLQKNQITLPPQKFHPQILTIASLTWLLSFSPAVDVRWDPPTARASAWEEPKRRELPTGTPALSSSSLPCNHK